MPGINMFFGDSHSRQFVGTTSGIFVHHVFSGATIVGLQNNTSITGHAKMIRYALHDPSEKTVFMMFGSVDFDFSLIRAMCLNDDLDVDLFVERRVLAYANFISSVIDDPSIPGLKKLVVIGPQVSPLMADNFFFQTYRHTGQPEAAIRKAASRYKINDLERAARIIEFNDRLEARLRLFPLTRMIRIDKTMVDQAGHIKREFVPADKNEHHAAQSVTKQLWWPLANEHITDRDIVG